MGEAENSLEDTVALLNALLGTGTCQLCGDPARYSIHSDPTKTQIEKSHNCSYLNASIIIVTLYERGEDAGKRTKKQRKKVDKGKV